MIAQLREDKVQSGEENLAMDILHTGGNSQKKGISESKDKVKSKSKSKDTGRLKEENKFHVEGKHEDWNIKQAENNSQTDDRLIQIPLIKLEQDIEAKDNPENTFNLTKHDEVESNSSIKLKPIINAEESEKDVLKDETIQREDNNIDNLEHMNNETLEKCPEIPKHLQGKLLIRKEVQYLFFY